MSNSITHQEYTLTKRNLIGGTVVVLAHGMGWPDGDFQRVTQLKIKGGSYYGKFLNSGRWIEIDGLR